MATEIAPGVYRLQTDYPAVCGLPLWLHVVGDGDELVLLDAGVASTPGSTTAPELASLGLALSDLTLVVNSHAHPDHMGGNANLRELTAAKIAGPAAEVTWLEDNDTLLRELWGADPDAFDLSSAEREELLAMLDERVRIDVLLRDGDVLDVGEQSLRVVTTSGHSPGHIAVFHEDSRMLFAFDDVQGRGQPYLDGSVWLAPLYTDVERYVGGLERLLKLDFDALVPSHGDILDADAGRRRIEESLAWVADTHDHVRSLVDGPSPVTVRDVAASIGTQLGDFGGVCLQTVRMARAHLDLLTREGLAQPRWHSLG